MYFTVHAAFVHIKLMTMMMITWCYWTKSSDTPQLGR